jgi:hypothetical protein
MTEKQRIAIARAHFQGYARSILERGILWWASPERLRRLIKVTPAIPTKLSKERPTIYLCPHFVCLEVAGTAITMAGPACSIYVRQHSELFDEALRKGRLRFTTDERNLLARNAGIKPITFEIDYGAAQSPDASVGSATGLEDQHGGIAIPINVTLNADRIAFEKVGFEITATDSAIQSGSFIVNTLGGRTITSSYQDQDEKWVVFNGNDGTDEQIDFSTLKYIAPPNYSGDANFIFTSFSKIGKDESVIASNKSIVNISIEPVAESIAFNAIDTIATIISSEDSAVPLPLASYFNPANFETGSGIRDDEKISIEIRMSSTITLQKMVAGTATTLSPVTSSNGVSTYVVNASQANLNTELSGYQILPSANYHSESLLGSDITIKATPYEPSNGASGSSVTTTVNLVIAPVADTPNAPFVVRSAVTINESQANTPDWYLLGDAIKLPTSSSTLSTGENLSVIVTAPTALTNLALRSEVGGQYTYPETGIKGPGRIEILGDNQFSVSVSDFSKLKILLLVETIN